MIKEITASIFEKYEVRKSKKQKTAFIEYIQGVCQQSGIPCTVEKKGISRNVVMGASPEDSTMLITGHYDTCARMIVPNFITPKNPFMFILYQLLITVLLLVPGLIIGVLVGYLTDMMILAMPIYGIVTLLLCVLMMFGPANKHTANDNTSGTIAVLSSMLAMTSEQRSRVCFVLFDNEEIGLVGSSAFASMHKEVKKSTPVVNLDCVSDGDYLFAKMAKVDKNSPFGIQFKKAMEDAAGKHGMTPVIGTKGIYPSDQASFKRGIGVACLNRSRLIGLYMNRIHTSRDTVFTQRNIDCLTEAMVALADTAAAE